MRMIRPLSGGAALRRLFVATALGLLVAGGRLKAQECPAFQPLPEHAILAAAEGTFDLDFPSPEGSAGSSSCNLDLGGQWLLEDVKATFCGKPYLGRGATSYDPAKKKFVNVWIDSVSPVPLISEGTYDKSTRTLTLVGDMVTPFGTAKATLLTVFKDADTRTFTLTAKGPDGKDVEAVRIVYKRSAK